LQTIRFGTIHSNDITDVLQRPKDVLAVEWLSRTVIASGFRDSLLFLSDLRSNDSVQRIKHPGMIGQIKKIDDHQFVVAGTRSVSHIHFSRFCSQFPLMLLLVKASNVRFTIPKKRSEDRLKKGSSRWYFFDKTIFGV
jgi:hypothetical protein